MNLEETNKYGTQVMKITNTHNKKCVDTRRGNYCGGHAINYQIFQNDKLFPKDKLYPANNVIGKFWSVIL